MNRLAGRVVLVTGGSRGIGRAVALRLALDGARVAVNYRRDRNAAREVVEEVEAAGGRAAAYQASVDDEPAIARMVAAVRAELGPVSAVISNAGAASKGHLIGDMPLLDLLDQMAVHAFGPLSLIQSVLEDLRAAERGDIVMISSATVATTPSGAAAYTMAKAAMETCVRTLAREERVHGIRANIVAPGLVGTEMGRRLVAATTGGSLDQLADSSPFGRVCHPDDVAGVVSFLLAADSAYVTGQHITVDGGGHGEAIF